MGDLREKAANLEDAAASFGSLEAECKKKTERLDILSEKFESLKKEKTRLEKELKASEAVIQSKFDELVGMKRKLASFEDVQERLRGEIVKDANQISDLSS